MATYSSIKQSVLEATSIARVIATNYNSVDSLPTSGNVVGEQALVLGDSATDRLYIWEGSAWYQIALIQNSPTFTTSPDDTYELATDGVTTTVITLAATDPEGFPVTFSAVTNVGFDSIATVSQDSSVFTVTPFSQDSAGTSRSGTITFKASDGISVASAISTFTITFKIVNSNFTSTLIKASGNNGSNTTINDASASNRSITVNGDISAQAFTPFHPGGYSAYFDGSGDYLLPAITTAVGTNDFTLEGWFYFNSLSSDVTLFDFRSSGNWGIFSIFGSGSNALKVVYYNGGSNQGITTNTVTVGEWNHIAIVRASGVIKIYINGILGSTTSDNTSWTIAASPRICANKGSGGAGSNHVNGYASDVRFVNGTAVYTANFTPPSSRLTAITNTELLVCHLPYLADGSSNDHTVTFAGNVATKRFAPYDHIPYDPSIHGASLYNDGTGDYMTTPADTTDLTMSGDFTIDFWYYPVAAKNMGYVYGKWNNQSDGWALWVTPNYSSGNFGYVTFYYGNYGSNECASNLRSTIVTLNQWHYIRVTRSSGTMYMSVNGKVGTRTNYTSGITFTDNRTFNANTTIGITGNSVGYTLGQAFISDLRVINGTALTTGNFTPPTSPATAVTNTKLLTCNDAPNVYNASGRSNPVVLGGDAKSSTAQTKNASASMYFDGSGDRVDFANLGVGTGDFEIECWFRQTVSQTTDYRCIFGASPYTSSTPFALFTWSNLLRAYIQGNSWIEFSPFSINTWYHLAIKRENGLWTFFVDGTSQGTSTLHATYDFDSTVDWSIMAHPTSTSYDQTGYIEDFRLTTDLIKYPFIPAKETLTAVSGTSFLTAHAATITDGSSNSLSITSQGDPTVSNFAPSPGMKSIHFDGNDYLEIADGTYKTFGSDNWTIEAWVYPTEAGTGFGNYIWGDTASSGSTNTSSTAALYNSSGKFGAYITVGSSTILTLTASNLTTPANKWYKIALVREGNTFTLFVDGTVGATATNSNAVLDSGQILTVGRTGAYNGLNFVGYVSNYRIVKGTALYTNSFTPPTAELEA